MGKLYQIKDGISPDLLKKARAVGNPQRHLKAMGRAVVSLGKRAFKDSSLRPSVWAARKDSHPHPLLVGHHSKGKTVGPTLSLSIRVLSLSTTSVTIGSDRKYAVIHQLGGKAGRNKASNIPARPYLPFKQGKLTRRGKLAVERALQASLGL